MRPVIASTIVISIFFLSVLQTPALAQEISIEQIAKRVQESKTRLLRYPGGMSLECSQTAVHDPTHDFAFKGKWRLTTAIKWPKLYSRTSGEPVNSSQIQTRVSVYDFEKHMTIAFDRSNVEIVPGRHMFSSGGSMLFRCLHFAEGMQAFRQGTDNKQLNTVPECFEAGGYEVVGFETRDDTRCVHVRSDALDDIWIAVDRGYLVHRREQRYAKGQPLMHVTFIQSYRDLSNGLWLPGSVISERYFAPDDTAERQNHVFIALRLDVDNVELGQVSDSLFDLELPDGAQVTDLINNKTYYNNRPFDSVVDRPSSFLRTVVLLNVAVLLTILAVIIYHRLSKRARKKQ